MPKGIRLKGKVLALMNGLASLRYISPFRD